MSNDVNMQWEIDFGELVQAMEQDKDLDLNAVRAVLLRSPRNEAVLAEHGQLLAQLMDRTAGMHHGMDVLLLTQYLCSILALDTGTFMQSRKDDVNNPELDPKPYYDAFHSVMHSLDTSDGVARAHPVLQDMVIQGGVEPTDVVLHLNGILGEQIRYTSAKEGMAAGLEETAQGVLLLALRPLLTSIGWRPTNPLVYEQLWEVHSGLGFGDDAFMESKEAAFIASMVQERPSSLHHALHYLAGKLEVRDRIVDAFFPLPLAGCNGAKVVPCLVRLTDDDVHFHQVRKNEAFASRLQLHHPDIAHLVQMHANLFPDAHAARKNAGAMVESLERLVGTGKVGSLPLPEMFDGA